MSERLSPTSDGSRVLLYVHGRDFKPGADELADICLAALTAGIKRDYPDLLNQFFAMDKELAYYGDLTNAFLSDVGQRYDEPLDVGDRRNALKDLRLIEKRKNFGVSRYDRLPGKTAVAEFAADIAGPLLSSLGLSKKAIQKLAPDVGEYWNNKSSFAANVRERVRAELFWLLRGQQRILLISHGTTSLRRCFSPGRYPRRTVH